MAIVVKIKNLEKLTELASKFPAASEKHINKAINSSLVRIFGQEKQEAPFGTTGQLRDRWNILLGRFVGKLRSGVAYALAVHEGTKPNPRKIGLYKNPDFVRWAVRRGLNPFLVARSIAKKGTKANPFLQRAVDKEEKAVDREFENALKNIVADIT